MYLEFFGLREQPFQLTPDPHFLFLSKKHVRAKAYMDYTVWRRDGFVVITGEIGAGKTTLIRSLLSEIDGTVKVVHIYQTQLNEIEFLQAILVELGIDPRECTDASKVLLLTMLKTHLVDNHAHGKHVVLIVDEAQNLSPMVLEEIRMLAGIEIDQEKLLNVILVGQPELNETLRRPDLQQLVQRIRLRYHVGALSEEEIAQYVAYRMVVAGAPDGSLFEPDTIPLIYKYSGGVPRRINMLCDTALICAFADSKMPITRNLIMDAVKELQWIPFEQVSQRHQWPAEPVTPLDTNTDNKLTACDVAPQFIANGEHWGQLFSLVLKVLGDVSERMKNVDEQLRTLHEAQGAGAQGLVSEGQGDQGVNKLSSVRAAEVKDITTRSIEEIESILASKQ
jgi:general secretion pathway protein A